MENLVTELSPAEAWAGLKAEADSALVDVRTKAEWNFVGTPDLSSIQKSAILLEWMRLPGMAVNTDFTEELLGHFEGSAPSKIFFLCRSGARSMQAAQTIAMAAAARGQSIECVNVAEGFEGDLNTDGHRGQSNGWKARGLSWRQS